MNKVQACYELLRGLVPSQFSVAASSPAYELTGQVRKTECRYGNLNHYLRFNTPIY